LPLRARKALASVVAGEKVLDSIARPAIAIFGLIASDLQDEIRNTSVNALNKVLKKVIINQFVINIQCLKELFRLNELVFRNKLIDKASVCVLFFYFYDIQNNKAFCLILN
jgi:hypothetical protein